MEVSFCLSHVRFGCMGASLCTLQEPAWLLWCCSFPSFGLPCFFCLNPLMLFFSRPWSMVPTEKTPAALRSFILPYRKVRKFYVLGFFSAWRIHFTKFAKLCNIIVVPKNLEVVKVTAFINDTIKHCVNSHQVLHAPLLGFPLGPLMDSFQRSNLTMFVLFPKAVSHILFLFASVVV